MEENDTVTQISSLLGLDTFIDLLNCLPDAFFVLDQAGKIDAWKRILHLVNRGESDPEILAKSCEVTA